MLGSMVTHYVRRKPASFQQNNANPHTARKTSNKIEKLDAVEV